MLFYLQVFDNMDKNMQWLQGEVPRLILQQFETEEPIIFKSPLPYWMRQLFDGDFFPSDK